MKRRDFINIGEIDKYPEIDGFIPEAERVAKLKFPDKSIPGHDQKVSLAFINAMNAILVKNGLRVL
jgi:hypothetical protein